VARLAKVEAAEAAERFGAEPGDLYEVREIYPGAGDVRPRHHPSHKRRSKPHELDHSPLHGPDRSGRMKGDHISSNGVAAADEPIHVLSATVINTGRGGKHHLAMCGEDLGLYQAASIRHPVGNYIAPRSKQFAQVTCQPCRAQMNETWDRWYARPNDHKSTQGPQEKTRDED
jgi:hypothetical protein